MSMPKKINHITRATELSEPDHKIHRQQGILAVDIIDRRVVIVLDNQTLSVGGSFPPTALVKRGRRVFVQKRH